MKKTQEELKKIMEMCCRQLQHPKFAYVKKYLNDRYITNEMIDFYQLGIGRFYGNKLWITIPIKDLNDNIILFKLRKDPTDENNKIKYIAYPKDIPATIFGMKEILNNDTIAINEGECDKMILSSQGVPTITSTVGSQGFKKEWLFIFKNMKKVFLIFDKDKAGMQGSKKLGNMILEEYPNIEVYNCILPKEVGEHGDITDLMILSKGQIDIDKLLYKDSYLMKLEKKEEKKIEYKQNINNEIINQNGSFNFDIEKLKLISIKKILEQRGIEIVNDFFKIRGEKTASAKFYRVSNSYWDFGDDNSGSSNIDLIMALDKVDFISACHILNNMT